MTRRIRPGAKLSDKHREVLIDWLFNNNLSYAKAQARLAAEFNVKISINAIAKFYHRIERRRTVEKIITSDITYDSEAARASLNQLIFDAGYSGEKPDVKTLIEIHKLLLLAKGRHNGPSIQRDFRRDTARKILRWATDPGIVAIVQSDAPEGEKIERIMKVVFAPVSGVVQSV